MESLVESKSYVRIRRKLDELIVSGVQCEEELESIPPEDLCRPYIEKALKDLGTGNNVKTFNDFSWNTGISRIFRLKDLWSRQAQRPIILITTRRRRRDKLEKKRCPSLRRCKKKART